MYAGVGRVKSGTIWLHVSVRESNKKSLKDRKEWDMLRVRFTTSAEDYRPVNWPIRHPYWCTGYTSRDDAVIVSYADDEAYIMENWPEAEDLDVDVVEGYVFTDRFPRPDWLKE